MRRVRPVRGFTLVEVVVAVSISVMVLVVLARWLVGLLAATGMGNDASSVQREARLTTSSFARDLAGAQSCDPLGLTPPLAAVSPDELMFYADVSVDGLVDLVAWRLTDAGVVEREVWAGDGTGCDYTGVDGVKQTITSHAEAAKNTTGGSEPAFSVIDDGVQLDATRSLGACSSSPQSCLVEAAQMHIVVVQTDGPATANAFSTVLLPVSGTRLQ